LHKDAENDRSAISAREEMNAQNLIHGRGYHTTTKERCKDNRRERDQRSSLCGSDGNSFSNKRRENKGDIFWANKFADAHKV